MFIIIICFIYYAADICILRIISGLSAISILNSIKYIILSFFAVFHTEHGLIQYMSFECTPEITVVEA